jgi:hypothetical protein
VLIVGGNQSAAGGYEVDNSLRFDSGSSDYLNRTPSSASNRDLWSISAWVKRSKLGIYSTIYGVYTDASNQENFGFLNNDKFQWQLYLSGGVVGQLTTNRVFRDVSSWYHILGVYDSANGTAGNRMRLYINGVEETSFATDTNPSSGQDSLWNNNTLHMIGSGGSPTGGDFFDGYMSELVAVDGTALSPTDLGEFDADTGIWKPIDVSGLTFGTNGFYLPFENSAALGQDDSGNGNNFTVNNLTSIDQTTDTPTNNYATGNALLNRPTYGWATLSEGNLKHSSAGLTNSWGGLMSNIIPSAGKWYAEVYCQGGNSGIVGVANAGTFNVDHFLSQNPMFQTGFWGIQWNSSGKRIENGSIITDANVTNFMSNGIVGIALDCDNQELTTYINGSVISTVNGLDISNTTSTDAFAFMSLTPDGGPAVFNWNFGNPPFTISSGNSDANGYGNFEYAVPSGYYALNTKNLAEYG